MTHSTTTRFAAMFGTVARWRLPALAALLGLHLGGASARADLLYVSQANNNTIATYDTTASPPIATTFASTGLNYPVALAFDAAGNLYASNYHNNTIEKFTPGGVGSVFASVVNPAGLAFDAAGNLYVANSIEGGGSIEKFTPGGVGSVFASTGVSGPNGLAFDSAGNLYVGNTNANTIEKFTPGGVGSVFASTGVNLPYGLAFDSTGNLYVANNPALVDSTIEKFTPGGVGSVFATFGTAGGLNGLVFDSVGNLYANLNGISTIEKFTPGGVSSVFATNPNGLSLGLAIRPSSVPEPSSLVLAIIGATVMLGYGCYRGRKQGQMAKLGSRVGAESNAVPLI